MNPIIEWLLEDDTPEVKFRTMIELLELKKEDSEVKEVYQSLLASDTLKMIMDKFKLKNKWEDINAISSLSELGLTRFDVPIDEYIDRIIKEINQSSMKCAKILLLRNLVKLGYYDNPWVSNQIKLSFSTIREDGSIRCLDTGKKRNDSRLKEMGCYRQTTTYLLLAAELKKIGVYLPEFEKLIAFYLEHHVIFHQVDEKKIIVKEMAGTFYPIDHVHIGLEVIFYALSIMGVADNINCREAWALLNRNKDKEGKYVLDESFPEPYFYVGELGYPNKWVTLYVLLSKKYSGILD